MSNLNTTRVAEESELPESYPTFWDAIPVDPVGGPAAPPVSVRPPEDAYTRFINLTEDGRPVTLTVEESDVGRL
jgi:hypothetical protein